ncbi:hypothetical protein CRG98_027257 [Punica granatum]|uniref:Reverse transcriptase Ty1/copia-type domain-containing protein n=1 Tax=Punica granatum TaxID=22663 RepID=A0A2I0J7W0_PUNGR|nr:hypothetical protein CRG98_027257 [Punica granatum]
MGNGQSCKIVGIGDVCLETELRCKLLLNKVKHVPKIHLNLILTCKLDDECYNNEFSNGRWKLSKGSLIVARSQKTNTLYRMYARYNSGQAKLSKFFWGEAMKTTVDLINITPSVALDGDVPQQAWTGKEVLYKYLRIFEFRASVHISRDERSKLDTKAKQCIFLSNAHEEFGYSFWDPNSTKIIRSRDVVFFEDQTIKDLQKLKKTRGKKTKLTNRCVVVEHTLLNKWYQNPR